MRLGKSAIAAALLGALPIAAEASALSSAASGLAPGSWTTLTTTNIATALGPAGSGMGSNNTVLAESGEMQWYSASAGNGKVFFYGSDHCDTSQFVEYDEATNQWNRLARPPNAPSTGGYCAGMEHGEEGNAIDTTNGIFYYKTFFLGDRNVYAYNIAGASWSTLPALPSGAGTYYDPALPLAYFPEMGALVLPSPGGAVDCTCLTNQALYTLSNGAGSWTRTGLSLQITGTYRNEAHHSPVRGLMLFSLAGFGDTHLWKLASNGTITALRTPPVGTGIMCPCDGQATIIRADDVTGDFLVISNDDTMWAYDISNDSWRKLSSDGVPSTFKSSNAANLIFGTAGVYISDYDVFMFPSCANAGGGSATCNVSLFKRSEGAPVAAITDLVLN